MRSPGRRRAAGGTARAVALLAAVALRPTTAAGDEPLEADDATEPPEIVDRGVDDATGYYVMFTIAATAAELATAGAVGLGISEVEGAYRLRTLADRVGGEAGESLRRDAENREITGWIAASGGLVLLGLSVATDVIIGQEWTREGAWYLRPCLTTPIAATGVSLAAAGISRLLLADDFRAQTGTMSLADRRTTLDEAADIEVAGRVLVSLGVAAFVGAGVAWLLDAVLEPDTASDEGDEPPPVALVSLSYPGGFGLGLRLDL